MFKEKVFPFQHMTPFSFSLFLIPYLIGAHVAPQPIIFPFPISNIVHVPETPIEPSLELEPEVLPSMHAHAETGPVVDFVTVEIPSRRRSTRRLRPPIWLQDYITALGKSSCLYLVCNHISYDCLSSLHGATLAIYSAVTKLN